MHTPHISRSFGIVLGAVIVLGAAATYAMYQGILPDIPGISQPALPTTGIHKIKHVVIIMQENRSFDSYFGTFPGTNGIPMQNGAPTVCVNDPRSGQCVKPYHDTRDLNGGGPHAQAAAIADVDGGKMDGFLAQAEQLNWKNVLSKDCGLDPRCFTLQANDVMGYHTDAEIPNYWSYAKNFVLQDNLFGPNAGWSLPAHLFMVSGWSAKCSTPGDPMSCVNEVENPTYPGYGYAGLTNNLVFFCRAPQAVEVDRCLKVFENFGKMTLDQATQLRQLIVDNCSSATHGTANGRCRTALQGATLPEALKQKLLQAADVINSFVATPTDYAWTDLTYLLHRHGVSWAYYVLNGKEPDCEDDSEATCVQHQQNAQTPGIWNPLPFFDTVKQDGELGNIRSLDDFFIAAKAGTLPAVSWITPSSDVSEHPPATVSAGQTYVTGLINAIMKSPDWDSTAVFLSWDDWGGIYDHVVPPQVDQNGYGLRVPGLVISPYAKRGYIDHQTLSHDAYLKFIEDDFLGGARIDARTDGRPDPRPTVRENVPILGDLARDFDFSQPPRPPLILDAHPANHQK